MKRVVIVGGGFAGAYIARHLEKKFDAVLIDTKDYFEFTPSILRTIINPKHAKKIQVLHKNYLKRAQVIVGHATKISDKEVLVGEAKVNFDYLVIATGSRYRDIFKELDIILPNRAKELVEKHEKLASAQEVLIIGGGVVGVELAGEIATAYPKKNVTIVHSKDRLLERNNLRVSEYAKSFLSKHKVKIIFNERVVKRENGVFITDKGTQIKTDIPFICTGIISNGEVIKEGLPPSVNEKNQALVNRYLQLQGYNNIFVAGDVTSIEEEKLAHNAEHHAMIIIKNIKNMENARQLKPYISSKRVMVISLGKYNAIFLFKNFSIHGKIPALMKWVVELKTMIHYRRGMAKL